MGIGGRAGAEGAETDRRDRQQDNIENTGSPGQTANKPGLVFLPEMRQTLSWGAYARSRMTAP